MDITGEVAWVRQMIEIYDELAFKSGARIINCSAMDSMPFDLLVWNANQELIKKGEKLVKVEFYDQFRGTYSGGTFSTIMNSFRNKPP